MADMLTGRALDAIVGKTMGLDVRQHASGYAYYVHTAEGRQHGLKCYSTDAATMPEMLGWLRRPERTARSDPYVAITVGQYAHAELCACGFVLVEAWADTDSVAEAVARLVVAVAGAAKPGGPTADCLRRLAEIRSRCTTPVQVVPASGAVERAVSELEAVRDEFANLARWSRHLCGSLAEGGLLEGAVKMADAVIVVIDGRIAALRAEGGGA